jgi:hypothetical protein
LGIGGRECGYVIADSFAGVGFARGENDLEVVVGRAETKYL